MKKQFIRFIAIAVFSTGLQGSIPVADVPVTFRVSGIKEVKGHMVLALYKKNDDFPDQPSLFVRLPVENKGLADFVWKGIPEGEYAASIYQDLNGNEKLDTNFMGIPTEPYAFGNDSMGTFGPPSWDQSKVTVKNGAVIKIELRH